MKKFFVTLMCIVMVVCFMPTVAMAQISQEDIAIAWTGLGLSDIKISENGPVDFGKWLYGYADTESYEEAVFTFKITNNSTTNETGDLTIKVENCGDENGSTPYFMLGKGEDSILSIPAKSVDGEASCGTFTLKPAGGLDAGTYVSTIKIMRQGAVLKEFDVQITVVTVAANPVKSISYEVNPVISFYENCNGEYREDDNGKEYFYYGIPYDLYKNGTLTINYTDNNSKTYTYYYDNEIGEGFKENEGEGFISIDDIDINDTQWKNHWSVGGENQFFEVEYMGQTAEVPVKIIANPVWSISLNITKPVEFYENVGGELRSDEAENKFFLYSTYNIFEEICKEEATLTVTKTDGTSVTYKSGYYEDDDVWSWGFKNEAGEIINLDTEYFHVWDNQCENHWEVNGSYNVEVEYMGRTAKVPVTVVANPVQSISLNITKPVEFYENIGGEFCSDYEGKDFFAYYNIFDTIFKKGTILTVTKTNNTTDEYVFDYYDENGCWGFKNAAGEIINSDTEYFHVWDDQWEEHWEVNGSYNVEVEYMGKTAYVPVTIVANPVQSISYEVNPGISFYENCNGEYRVDKNGQEYFDYWLPNGFYENGTLTINYADNTSKTYTYYYDNEKGSGFKENEGDGFISTSDIDINDTQWENHWSVNGGDKYFEVEYMGRTAKVPVTIVPMSESSLAHDKLYCINWENVTYIDDTTGLIAVSDVDSLRETLNLELNWPHDLCFVKLNEQNVLQAVNVSTDTQSSTTGLLIDNLVENGVTFTYAYTIWADNIGEDTITEAVEGNTALVIRVKSSLPVFGSYYSEDISAENLMSSGFSYLLSGDALTGNKTFYVALKKDEVQEKDLDKLWFKFNYDNEGEMPVEKGITVGKREDNKSNEYYIWPVSVSDEFRNLEDKDGNINTGVYIILYCEKEWLNWDFYNIYDSQTIPEENQLVWVDMSDGKTIDEEGYISTKDGNDFDNNFEIIGKKGDKLSNICFGYVEENHKGEDVKYYTKVLEHQVLSTDIFEISENSSGYYDIAFKNAGKTVFQLNDTSANKSYLMFVTVSNPSTSGGGGGGGGGAAPAETTKPQEPTQSGTTTTADLSGSTTSKGGQTTTTVDKTTADKLVETAVSGKSEEIVISAVTKNQSAASSTKSSEVALPADTLQTIAEKTNADIVIKTNVAEVKLDNKAAEAVASQAQAGTAGKNETVSIVAEKVKEEAKEVRIELKVVTSGGAVISDFKGGNATVTVNVPKSLSNKNIVCVYIDENGYMHKMDGRLNSDGTYSFTTGHFSTYAIMSEEEVNEAIKEQKEAVKSVKLKLRSQLVKTKSGKKAIKLTWTNPSDIELDGVEIYRSVKKNSGYGKKPIGTSKTGKYINTSVKSGKKYYYKVRGFVTIDGEKVYTAWSTKAYRTMK